MLICHHCALDPQSPPDNIIKNGKGEREKIKEYNKKEFSCGAIVYKEEGGKIFFLIVHSKRNNEWGFPKGHIEKGESERQTAKREIFEETGIKKIEFIDGFRHEEIYNINKNSKEEIAKRKEGKDQKQKQIIDRKEEREKRKESKDQKQRQIIEKHSIYFLAKSSCRHCEIDPQFHTNSAIKTMADIVGQARNDSFKFGNYDNSDEIDERKWLQLNEALNHLKFENQKNILKEANRKIKKGGK